LFSNLKLLLAAAHDGLQHLMWTDMSFEVARVPQLAQQLTEPLNENEHLVARRSLYVTIILLTQEIVAHWSNMR